MISQAELKSLLEYDPETGVFTWRKSRGGFAVAGTAAGTQKANGYVRINLRGEFHYAHRLAWFYVTGEWPKEQVDHIDGNPANNQFANLREASCAQNSRNYGAHCDNAIGLKGVTRTRQGKFQARIFASGRRHHLGLYDTATDAHAAYVAAAAKVHGEFAHG